jgi:2-oxoglutarate dehydrogenase E1 component
LTNQIDCKMDRFSFLNAVHTQYIEDLYQQYLKYPDAIEPSWKSFFQGYDFALELYDGETPSFAQVSAGQASPEFSEEIGKEFKVINLINAYRNRGHLFTKTNPIRQRRSYSPDLAIENFGLSQDDLSKNFSCSRTVGLKEGLTLLAIIEHLQEIYCESLGYQYMYIPAVEEITWIQHWLQNNVKPSLTTDEKKRTLQKLNQASAFENYLHTKFVGQKRFSLEGGESLIPGLDELINRSAKAGVSEVVLGMAHRGRLNVLTNIFKKSYKQIFSEFEGKEFVEDIFSGDVKYHLGSTTVTQTACGKELRLNLAPNPSHLETVAAVVEGITRAKVDTVYDNDYSKALPIIIHGDAAVAGQGIVYEVAQMMTLEGYKTGGTVHIVVNNQVGFTTNYLDARSSTYCTDIAKVTNSPVVHVNADDVEAVVHAMRFAADYRAAFQKDVYIDLLGYRKYGHNEGDEPRFTQPKLYALISKHENCRNIYKAQLEKEGVLDDTFLKEIEAEFKAILDNDFDAAKEITLNKLDRFMPEIWDQFPMPKTGDILKGADTTFPLEQLKSIALQIAELPKEAKILSKTRRLFEQRVKMATEGTALDWASGELLAYASLLAEDYSVRLSGEDVERGTFSHRHAVVKTEDTEEKIVPLRTVDSKGKFSIFNSHLSEYGVLGFDYGYAMTCPQTLTIWEAQFGDFMNGAQIVIDQYLVAAEEKWIMQNGLVMLLPHGYEGQGAEHSSARLERFLQACANDNMVVANVTTPANYFHLLRRQLKFNFRKPLVVMSPKSLLRHPLVVSPIEEMANGSFQTIIDDATANAKKVERVVMCSGKLYYELLAKKEELKDEKVALIRLEQLYPLDQEKIDAILAKYSAKKELVWAQEEPENMGAWWYIMRNFRQHAIECVSPVASGSTAPGTHRKFDKNQKAVIAKVFQF